MCPLGNRLNIDTYDDISCECGCRGWWHLCANNKANRERFHLSPPPSPHRTDDDWFTKEDNPVYTGTSMVWHVPTVPSSTHHHTISAKYLARCVDVYFNKENC